MPSNPDTLVIGGGLAGLTAALHLAERGLAPLVLEADPRYPGGRMAGGDTVTLEHGGRAWSFRGEHGVHGVWSPYRNLQAMLARHGLRPAFVPSQEEDWIYKRGDVVHRAGLGSAIRESWIPAPFHYLNLFLRPRFLGMLGPGDWLSLFLVGTAWCGRAGDRPAGRRPAAGRPSPERPGWGWSPAVRAF
jgi:isorenieratene synthase